MARSPVPVDAAAAEALEALRGNEETISTEIPALLAGVRVDRGVAMVADVSRAAAAELIDAGCVRSTACR